MRFGIRFLVVAGMAVGLWACGSDPVNVGPAGPEFTAASKPSAGGGVLEQINAKLAVQGKAVRALKLEYITLAASDKVGQTVYAKDVGNKQLDAHWVPGDPERGGGTHISYAIDEMEGSTASGLTTAQTSGAIVRAMDTWENANCSTVPLVNLDVPELDLGYVQWLVGMGGLPGWAADLTHAGWLPRAFFDVIASPDGGDFILGVTFTFVWVDTDTGAPTDIDGNGKDDVAFREIYYNDNFSWAIDGTVDVESIALHEVGHGLSQGHFGKVFRTKNGKLHFAPRAVMNAVYVGGVEQVLTGTDNAGHCSIWGSWPNN